ncbi:MAG: DUF445 domain-containing protein [Nitrospiraceae bacterium]|nr:DUF445 domain-containing protein [Nitrospiraceae bacterium]
MTTSPSSMPVETHPFARTRTVATGLLLCMALLFGVAVIGEPAHPWLSWVRSFAEAAMVGALADWYAVTVLFRHPMGLQIPHTAIIPANKDRIAARIGSLTQRQLMTPAGIARLIGSWRIPEELTRALLDRESRLAFIREAAKFFVRGLDACEDAAMQRCLRDIAAKVVRGVAVAPLAGQLLAAFLRSSRRDRLLNDVLSTLIQSVEANRPLLCTLIAEKLPWSRVLNFMKLDDTLAGKVLDRLLAVLRTMRDNPDDAMRAEAIERLEQLAFWLIHDEEALKQEAELKGKLLRYQALLEFIDESWHSLKQWMVADMQKDSSEILAYLDASLEDVGRMLSQDEALRAMLHQGVQGLVEDLAGRHSDKIAEMVAATIQDWSIGHMVDTIEREVGKDLQFIRINGTVVGGLVGILLHAIAQFLAR